MKGNAHEAIQFFAVNLNSGETFNILEQSDLGPSRAGMELVRELKEHETAMQRSPGPLGSGTGEVCSSGWTPAELPVG